MVDKKSGTVLKTLQDMGTLFEFGGEITPFLEELLTFLSDLMPILAKAKVSLQSTTSHMPDASSNISSADSMSADATHTIMDNADVITVKIDELIASDVDDTMKESLEELAEKINEINMALQFQDIISQHLQQATQIVEAIQSRMDKLFVGLQSVGEHNELVKDILDQYSAESGEEAIDYEDKMHRDEAVSQADIDALFGN
ncbi:MAG: hypothetical protein KAU50_03780 [Candidatus Marinimicrobia bacterium]|nr:hypothetical protein [Candidatus Neomarinimicrobiota bacterium]